MVYWIRGEVAEEEEEAKSTDTMLNLGHGKKGEEVELKQRNGMIDARMHKMNRSVASIVSIFVHFLVCVFFLAN